MSRAPFFATPELPGIAGTIKERPGDFVVEELPLYTPCGEGEHVYLTLRREGRTTREIELALGRLFRLPGRGVGLAGLKDKHARATQTFSLHLHRDDPAECARRVAEELGLEVLAAARHRNRLRLGHLLGNRFRVLLRGAEAGEFERAQAIAAALRAQGMPNFFGPQRFGSLGDNAERGRELFERPRKGWNARLLQSAWQSAAFHLWLDARRARGALPALLVGDVAKRHDGPIFDVEDLAREEPRRVAREIVPTGPMFGASMRWARADALALEREILAATGVDEAALARAGLPGTRRAAWIWVEELELESSAEGLWVGFRLPKGSYATSVLRELTKRDSEPVASEAGVEADEP